VQMHCCLSRTWGKGTKNPPLTKPSLAGCFSLECSSGISFQIDCAKLLLLSLGSPAARILHEPVAPLNHD
jgi:hypothetical protein